MQPNVVLYLSDIQRVFFGDYILFGLEIVKHFRFLIGLFNIDAIKCSSVIANHFQFWVRSGISNTADESVTSSGLLSVFVNPSYN